MTFFNNIKSMLGFTEYEEPVTEKSPHTPSYINPFKKEEPEVIPPLPTESEPVTPKAEVESLISDDIANRVADVLNVSLPEYARQCIDKNAQKEYVKSLIGSSIDDYLADVKSQAEETARQQWQKDRMDIAQKTAETTKLLNDLKTKNDDLRNRNLSLDRQRATLTERITDLEAKAATAEAEREQFELECKSLMNKIKVATVSNEALNEKTTENEILLAANDKLRQEIDNLKASSETATQETAAQLESAHKEIAEKSARIAELEVAAMSANDNTEEIARLSSELAAAKDEAAKNAESLQTKITEFTNLSLLLADTQRKLSEANSAAEALRQKSAEATTNTAELIKAKEDLAVRENELKGMRTTIQNQSEEIQSLNQRLNEADNSAKLDELEALRTSLEEQVAQLGEESQHKDIQISDLKHSKEEIFDLYEQLKKELERNKKHYANQEEMLRREIVTLTDKLDASKNEISLLSAEKKVQAKPAVKAEPNRSAISAIDYNSDDWLMPTPPSESIPISTETVAEKPEVIYEEPKPKKPVHNPNLPEQMELF